MSLKRKQIAIGIAVYIVFAFVLRSLLPNTATLVEWLQNAYRTYGYGIVFVFSFLEGIFVLGMFIPGTVLVMLGATLAARGLLSLPLVILSAAIGLWCGSMLNYWLGSTGWHRLLPRIAGAREQLEKAQTWYTPASWITFFSFASTGVGAAITTAAGALQVRFTPFAVFIAVVHLFWITTWAIIAYSFGVYIGNSVIAFAGVFALVLVIVVCLQWYLHRRRR